MNSRTHRHAVTVRGSLHHLLLAIFLVAWTQWSGGAEAPAKAGTEGGIAWAPSFETAIGQARAERRYVMVDFYTSWCGWCRRLAGQTYQDPGVVARVSRMVAVRIDGDRNRELAAKYGVSAYPTVLFLNPDATVRHTSRGFQAPEAFLQTLERATASESETFALETRVRFDPKDSEARLQLAELLALGDEHGRAAAHLDTLLSSKWGSGETQASIELDRSRFRIRDGGGEGVRRDLERWVARNRDHNRWAEGLHLLAELSEELGRIREARKLYSQVVEKAPDTWMGQAAAARLSDRP